MKKIPVKKIPSPVFVKKTVKVPNVLSTHKIVPKPFPKTKQIKPRTHL